MKQSKTIKFLLLAVCSGALFFHFSAQPSTLNLTTTTTQVAAKTTAKQPAITQVKVSVKQALKAYHNKYPQSSVSSLSLEKNAGKYRYEIEGVGDSKEYELKVDATSKKVYATESEHLDQPEQKGVKRGEKKLDTKKLLSLKQAVQTAQKKVKSGTVSEVSLDQELGITYWQVEFKQKDQTVKIQINAHSGKFLAKETSELDD